MTLIFQFQQCNDAPACFVGILQEHSEHIQWKLCAQEHLLYKVHSSPNRRAGSAVSAKREREWAKEISFFFSSFFLEHAGTLHHSEAKALKLAEKNINCSNKTHRVWHGNMVVPWDINSHKSTFWSHAVSWQCVPPPTHTIFDFIRNRRTASRWYKQGKVFLERERIEQINKNLPL